MSATEHTGILVAAAVTTAVSYVNAAARDRLRDVGPRPLVSGAAMAGVLSLIAETGSEPAKLATALAVLIAVSTAVSVDRQVLDGIVRLFGGRLRGPSAVAATDTARAGLSSLADIVAEARTDSDVARAAAQGKLNPSVPAPVAGGAADKLPTKGPY